MSIAFSQFCAGNPEVREVLRRRIDSLGQRGQSYEFPDCRMPRGCVPGQAVLGFLKRDRGYLLYWRPAVAYRGDSPVLSALFARSVWSFDSYEALSARLLSLEREVGDPAVPRPFRPQPLAEDPPSLWPPLYRRLRQELEQRVLGQPRAVEAAAFRLYTHAGKQNPARPLSLILHGPTGVGKSELGKALAPALERCRGESFSFVWTELNTFTQPHSVHRLTGAPPGYVGYEDRPIFDAVRDNPRTVFMFDELEKAHPEVLKVFMSILDEGRCTAHRADQQGGRELDFRRCVFVFTTNADLTAASGRPLGFSGQRPAPKSQEEAGPPASPAELAERLFRENEEARRAMVRLGVLPEIAGRFSGIIGFRRLDEEARRAVTVKQIKALGREYGLDILRVDPDTARALTPEGEDALSVRSSLCVLEGLLAPLLSGAPGRTGYRLSGLPGSLRLAPDYSQSSSTTAFFSSSSL